MTCLGVAVLVGAVWVCVSVVLWSLCRISSDADRAMSEVWRRRHAQEREDQDAA